MRLEGNSDDQRSLDFVVIGAQKAGTTSFWQYLRRHPRLCTPTFKEAAIFTADNAMFDRYTDFMSFLFADAPAGALRGTVTPEYMIGVPGVHLEIVVERIASTVPDVSLIALLRDPIERAVSSYMMAVRRGQEERSLDAALNELLDSERLVEARLQPGPTESYVVAGEYGRILRLYRAAFPAERLLVAFSEELARDPAAVLDTVLAFLGLPVGFRPDGLEIRYFQSGTRKLLDPESERLLFKFFKEDVLPQMRGAPHRNSLMFDFFYETWNVVPEESPPEISRDLRTKLEDHFRMDAERLAGLGIRAPWIARWDSQSPDGRSGSGG